MKTTAKIVSAFAFAIFTVGAQAVQLVANGDFQGTSIASWSEFGAFPIVGEHGVGAFGTGGNSYAWLAGYNNANDKLTQSVDFGSVAGTATLTFDTEKRFADAPGLFDSFTVKIGSTVLDTIDLGGSAIGFSGISTKTYDVSAFMGTGNQVLEFGATTNTSGPSSAFVDNVSIQAIPVPEPATMTILGIGLAAIARRKSA